MDHWIQYSSRRSFSYVAPLLFIFTLFAGVARSVYALPLNSDFESGLNSWTTTGAVSAVSQGVSNNIAQLSDGNGYANIFQAAALTSGLEYVLEFDYLNETSPDFVSGSFPDTVFGSLYFVNDLSSFDLNTLSFDASLDVLDADAFGQNIFAGTTSPSALGDGWMHYSVAFINSYAFGIPTFELFDLDQTNDGSKFSLDNVTLTARQGPTDEVPEPATLFLLGAGLLAGKSLKSKHRE